MTNALRDMLAEIEDSMTDRTDGATIVGAEWTDDPDLIRDIVREADGWANTHPEHPDAERHRRRMSEE